MFIRGFIRGVKIYFIYNYFLSLPLLLSFLHHFTLFVGGYNPHQNLIMTMKVVKAIKAVKVVKKEHSVEMPDTEMKSSAMKMPDPQRRICPAPNNGDARP